MSDAMAIKDILFNEELIDHSMMAISEDFDLIYSGVLDSIGIMKVILAYQKKNKVTVDISDITKDSFRTISNIILFLRHNSQSM